MTEVPLYLLEADWEGITAGADDEDFTPERAAEMAANIFNLGYERVQQLKKEGMEPHRDGDYHMPHCTLGYGADFYHHANYNIVKEKFPWLGIESDGTVLSDKTVEAAGDLERYLAKVPQEQWDEFIETVQALKKDFELDSDETSQLEREEEARWMREDGAKDLMKNLRAKAPDSFTAFVLSHINDRIAWAYCQEREAYPEAQGEGSVYLDFDKLIDGDPRAHVQPDPDALEWALEQFPNLSGFRKKWSRVKRHFYEQHEIFKLFDAAVRAGAASDAEAMAAYSAMDADDLYQFFLRLTPDAAYHEISRRPRWMPQLLDYGKPEQWMCILPPAEQNHTAYGWRDILGQALRDLMQSSEGLTLLKRGVHHVPLEHPELPLGEALEAGDDDVDPDFYVHGTGALRAAPVYRDRMIEIMEPRDESTLETLMGKPEGWLRGRWHIVWSDAVILAVLDRKTHAFLGAYDESESVLNSAPESKPILTLLQDPKYGKAVRKGFLKIARDWWNQGAEENDDDAMARVLPHLLTFGGPAELLKHSKDYGHLIKDYEMSLGIALLRGGQKEQAIKYLRLLPADVTEKGAWVYFPDYGDLASLFKHEESAEEALMDERYDWFDYLWENKPSIEDSAEWLDADAKKYIRDLLINRTAYFPDEGENKEGEYLVLTKRLLSDYTDDQLLQWVVDPTQEDLDDGVFDDIREAIVDGATDMLASAGRDQVAEAYRHLVREEFDVIEAKYVDHPTKPGHDRLAFLVPWTRILEDYDTMVENDGIQYSDTIDRMLLAAHNENIDTEHRDNSAEWPKKGDDSHGDYCEIASQKVMELDLTELQRQPEDPKQVQLPLGESVDDEPPESLNDWLDQPPENVRQNMLAVLQRLTQTASVQPTNIKMAFDRGVVAPRIVFRIAFDADVSLPMEHWYEMLHTLNSHVVNEMAQAGYDAQSFGRLHMVNPNRPAFEWAVHKIKFQ